MFIIIPLGGLGTRFKKNNYSDPKALIKIFGKPMLFYLIESINTKKIDFIYIPYNYEYKKFRIEDILKKQYPQIKFKFLCLESNTNGAAETIKISLEKLDIPDQPVLSLDSDNFYTCDIVNLWEGKNCIFYHNDTSDLDCFSFITCHNEFVIDIMEKNRISNNACVGAYGFNSFKNLLKISNDVVTSNFKFKNEFYISNVIKKMLEKNFNFYHKKIRRKDWHCLGTPLQLKYFYNNLPKISCLNSKKKISELRICFDLDNTLVTYPVVSGDYSTVQPIQKNIDFLKYLKSFGNTIIIHTARRMKTFSGNCGKVMADVGKLTFDTLHKFNIPYDEIYFGKPNADFYIDDLGVNCFDDLEKKLGFYLDHVDPRDFNTLELGKMETITKKSKDLSGEIYYYSNIPRDLKDLFPIFLFNKENREYTIEKINGMTCSSLYTSKLLTKETLIHIMNSINRIQSQKIEKLDTIDIHYNYFEKMIERYNSYNYSVFKDVNRIYSKIKDQVLEYKKSGLSRQTIIHGDTVMTNIIINDYDKIKFIDMRGTINGKMTLQGDWLYDWAKLYQSILGYDFILLNKNIDQNYIDFIKNVFNDHFIELYNEKALKYVKILTNSLLLSLIPLHDNEKCVKYFNLIKFE